MTNIPTGALIYLLVSFSVAMLLHWWIKNYFLASGASALAAPPAFALTCWAFADLPHAVTPKIFIFFSIISLIAAALVGAAFACLRCATSSR